jgi:hypothetical protein
MTLIELSRYFRRSHGRQVAYDQRMFVMGNCQVVERGLYDADLPSVLGEVKREDAEHLAATRALGIPHLVSSDSDFEGVKEWTRPADFLRVLGLKPKRSEV